MNRRFLVGTFAGGRSVALAVLLCGIFVALGQSSTLVPTPVAAQASGMSCGPYMFTFAARSRAGTPGTGIRCVLPTEYSTPGPVWEPAFAWYGEGEWQSNTYRHVGVATAEGWLFFRGYAGDIIGNGEDIAGSTADVPGDLEIRVVDGTALDPKELEVTGAWNEVWTRADEVPLQPLPRPRSCGSNFAEYAVGDLRGARNGSGIRCVLRRPMSDVVWFGSGEWGGGTYSHLGLQTNPNNSSVWRQSDLCGPGFGGACSVFRPESFRLTRVSPRGFNVTGDLSEAWR